MADIKVVHQPDDGQIEQMGVKQWPIWTKEESEFPWHYDQTETCYILEGAVEVTPEGGEPVEVGEGDLVTFPKGMACTWKIKKAIRKHYRFE